MSGDTAIPGTQVPDRAALAATGHTAPALAPMFGEHPPQSLDKDERYTPAWVFQGLGLVFDLDPASPGEGNGDCVPARRKLTKADDGLAQPWHGLVWLNPPFSNATAWSNRFIEHANGVFLGPIANGRWTHQMMKTADLLWLCRDFAFTHPTHAGKRSSMPLFFAAYGERAAGGLRRLAESARHEGVLVRQVAGHVHATTGAVGDRHAGHAAGREGGREVTENREIDPDVRRRNRADHVTHATQCGCLNDSHECCRAVCWCHDGRWSMPWPEYVAMRFHQAYEELAPLHGYETRRASAVPWVDVPEQNRDLMVDVVRRLLAEGVIRG